MCTVDLCGINNHEVTGILIITAGSIINTQHSPVIAIMPQYAYLGGGKTIHSAGQLKYSIRMMSMIGWSRFKVASNKS